MFTNARPPNIILSKNILAALATLQGRCIQEINLTQIKPAILFYYSRFSMKCQYKMEVKKHEKNLRL